MKTPIVASVAVLIAAIGVAGLADDRHLRQDIGELIKHTVPERVAFVLGDSLPGKAAAEEIAQAASPPEAEAQPEEPVVDESALRYFASKGDTARLEAEIARLRTLYPNWTPPENPLAVPRNADAQLETMWQLYSEGRYSEVRRAISERQSNDPGWQPPADLIERLDIAEARARLINASDLRQYETVIQVGARTPSLLTCSEVDVLWRVAEAFAQTDRHDRARDAYLYILKNCDDQSERLATLQKAAALLPYATVQELLSFERTTAAGTLEFETIRDDLARRFVAEGNDDAALAVDPKYLQRVERLVETQGLASDALLLGWYQLRRNNMSAAEQWFRRAHDKQDSAEASQGWRSRSSIARRLRKPNKCFILGGMHRPTHTRPTWQRRPICWRWILPSRFQPMSSSVSPWRQ